MRISDWSSDVCASDLLRGVIAAIAPHDSVERFEGLGVTVIQAAARFTAPRELVAGETTVKAGRFALDTGSSPALPPLPRLAGVPYPPHSPVFDMGERPATPHAPGALPARPDRQ